MNFFLGKNLPFGRFFLLTLRLREGTARYHATLIHNRAAGFSNTYSGLLERGCVAKLSREYCFFQANVMWRKQITMDTPLTESTPVSVRRLPAVVSISFLCLTSIIILGSDVLHAAEPTWTQGNKSVLFMRVAFPDDPSGPIGESGAVSLMNQVDAWYRIHSYDTLSFTSTITPLLMLPQNKSWYSNGSPLTLLNDARAAASAAGYDPYTFDLDIVRNNPVPGWNFSGTSSVGTRNLWLQATHLGLTVHELGHNLGLDHADSWLADDGAVVGPGAAGFYGNVFDTMGLPQSSPSFHYFNVFWMNRLKWLPDDAVTTIESGGVVRLWAYDVAQLTAGRSYALRVPASLLRDYWIEFRQAFSSDPFSQNGLIFNLAPRPGSLGDTQLLDMTPGSPGGANDSPLVVGRTYSDWDAGLHITPVATGIDLSERWIDVQVNIGVGPINQNPTVEVTPSNTSAAVDAGLEFSAAASDGDGDPLAYYWDFGDGTFGTNGPTATHSWSSLGEYVVRCSVTDMKGGTASDSVVIAVATPGTFRIEGSITEDGQPLENVGVYLSTTLLTRTISDGSYSLVGLTAGDFTVSAVSPGRTMTSSGFSNPVTVGPGDAVAVNFVSTKTPPEFQTQPQSQVVNDGADVSFYVSVSGAPPLYYQWHKDDGEIAGATTAALSVTNVHVEEQGAYTVEVGNSAGTNTSQVASLTVKTPPVITSQPQVQLVNVGDSASFSVQVSGNGPFFFQWIRDATNFISGASSSSYTIPSVTIDAAGNYSVLVANLDGTITSSNALLTVNRPPIPASPVLERLATQGVKAPGAAFLGSDPDGDTVSLLSVGPGTANGGTVSVSSGWVIYSPASGFTSGDSFSFSIDDGRGGIAVGMATVAVLPDDIIPSNLQLVTLSNGDYQLTFDGIPNRSYSVEYTEQLNPPAWQLLGNATADGNGRFSYTDSPPPDAPARYYRSVYP